MHNYVSETAVKLAVPNKDYVVHSNRPLPDKKYTVEPPNKGHFGDTASVLISEVVLFSEVKNIIMLW